MVIIGLFSTWIKFLLWLFTRRYECNNKKCSAAGTLTAGGVFIQNKKEAIHLCTRKTYVVENQMFRAEFIAKIRASPKTVTQSRTGTKIIFDNLANDPR